MLRTVATDIGSGKALEIIDDMFGHPNVAVSNHYPTRTRFKSVTRTSAGTSTISEPVTDGALLLADMIISCDRVAASKVTVLFDDGSNAISIFEGYANDAPINFAANFHGGWTGWKNAALKVTTVTAIKATVSVGYIKIPVGLEYDEWDELR